MTPENVNEYVLAQTGASSISNASVIQSLWSGYGQIVRFSLQGAESSSVILKHVKLPEHSNHPRGWNTDISHQRKVRSYQIEAYWYQNYAELCDKDCLVPECLAVDAREGETLLLLEDLDASGFDQRKTSVELADIHVCLDWLASFHATFLNNSAEGLWECGTYWHLDTRPDELLALEDDALRTAAPLIDQALKDCKFQTLVHGDAKLANFCFGANQSETLKKAQSPVAAVDFQYVGKGCGMKDVAYFIGSCLREDECEVMEQPLLDYYFSVLREQIAVKHPNVDFTELETEWRSLYPVAWADFHRFIKGWSPGHWKINSYSERLTAEVIASL